MGDATPILVAVVTTIGTIVAAAIAAGIIGRRRGGSPQAQVARWRDQADLEKARAELLDEQLEDEREARLATIEANKGLREQLERTRHDLDECVRQRDGAYSDLRASERRRGAHGTSTP